MPDFVKKEGAPTGDFRSDNNFLLGYFEEKDHSLYYRYDAERVIIEPWGDNSFRVRASKMPEMPEELWALDGKPENRSSEITIKEYSAEIVNGKIKAVINNIGKISFYNQKGELLLEEYVRNREDMFAETCSSLEVEAREFKPIIGGDYELTMRFESNPNEKIYGMGQYQQKFLDVKGAELELAHRNSQASVPFALSSLGYGFLWNNPAIGRVSFNKNITTWEARSTKKLDYWITAGDTPAEIEEAYADATGKVPMMPEYGLGFWQCKLRYQTQEELLEVAREYKRRQIPIDVIVVDFFHWPKQGDWRFDPTYWPDPDAMIAELKEMGIELMVSIWPMVDYKSENFEEMKAKGLLTRVEKGVRIDNVYMGNTIQYDPTNPEAREYVWGKAKKNYYDKGVKIFWLDEAEPEYTVYDFENYRYHLGPNVQIGNVYPAMYAKTFFDGMRAEGQENVVNLLRCAWAGSQKYGALVWSGDIHSTFESLQNQFAAGLNMGLSGIPWWTTDIGGFFGANSTTPFENPTVISNIIEMISMMLLPGACVVTFGHMLHDKRKEKKAEKVAMNAQVLPGTAQKKVIFGRQGAVVFGAMAIIFLIGLTICYQSEMAGNPVIQEMGIDQSQGSMEGKEVRFGVPQSALFTTVTTSFTTGTVNNMHDTLTPL